MERYAKNTRQVGGLGFPTFSNATYAVKRGPGSWAENVFVEAVQDGMETNIPISNSHNRICYGVEPVCLFGDCQFLVGARKQSQSHEDLQPR